MMSRLESQITIIPRGGSQHQRSWSYSLQARDDRLQHRNSTGTTGAGSQASRWPGRAREGAPLSSSCRPPWS